MEGWKEYKLGQVAEIQTGPFGSQLHQSDYKTVGTPIVTVEHLAENKILHGDVPLVGDEDKERLNKYALQEGDIVFSRVGSVDRRGYVGKAEVGWLFSGRCLRVRSNKELAEPRFLSFYFGQESFKEHIRMIAVGATMPSINTEILSNVVIEIPDLPEQRAIASVLSSLDDKVDLLHRQNKKLEAMAETLFRRWFVEEARECWDEIPLYDCIRLVGGGTPRTEIEAYWDGNVNWISGRDITPNHKGFIIETEKLITGAGVQNSSARVIPKLSTVISARGTVGKFCLLGKEMAFSQTNYGILPRFPNCYFFTYLLIAHSVHELEAAAYGSVFDTITTNSFKEHRVKLPPRSEIIDFEQKIRPFFKKMLSNAIQISTLSKMRDALLPKLMSGELRVSTSINGIVEE